MYLLKQPEKIYIAYIVENQDNIFKEGRYLKCLE